MKIRRRIPMPEMYSYYEVEFDSLEEYKTQYPLFKAEILPEYKRMKENELKK